MTVIRLTLEGLPYPTLPRRREPIVLTFFTPRAARQKEFDGDCPARPAEDAWLMALREPLERSIR